MKKGKVQIESSFKNAGRIDQELRYDVVVRGKAGNIIDRLGHFPTRSQAEEYVKEVETNFKQKEEASIDNEVVRELSIHWENDQKLYHQFTKTYVTYLNDKFVNNKYDKTKAHKLIMYFVEEIRTDYKKQYGLGTINKATKSKLASEILDYYEAEFKPRFDEAEKKETVKQIKELKKEGKSKNEAVEQAVSNVSTTGAPTEEDITKELNRMRDEKIKEGMTKEDATKYASNKYDTISTIKFKKSRGLQ